jgi:HPt (histidine-containing phosphotransfer) domain-containing protein
MLVNRPLVIDRDRILALRELQPPDQPDVVDQVIAMFLTDSAARLARARAAAAAADSRALRHEAHALRGSAGLLGADAVSQAASQLESVAAAGNLSDVELLMAALAEAVADAQAELASFT